MFIKQQGLLTAHLHRQGITNENVLNAIYTTPRQNFVQEAFANRCYENVALPIGHGQTISQPYITAKMTELLELKASDIVLEIGTGCGYQTALLAKLSQFVFSLERIKKLQWDAMRRLKQLDLHNVQLKHGDGWLGWIEKKPFDAIIVTAAPEQIPESLLQQLAENGRMVLPVGDHKRQILTKITKLGNKLEIKQIERVKFVPLIHGNII